MNSHIVEQKDSSILEDVLGSIGEVGGFQGFEEIASMLALPDEQFAMISELFLESLERSLNNPADKMLLIKSMNSTGTKMEDLITMSEDIRNEIDTQLQTVLTAPKKDFLKRIITMVINAISETEGIAKRLIQIPIERCHENAKIPVYANLTDAGADLIALEDINLAPGEQRIIPTGLKMAIPTGYAILVQPRSGLSSKTKLRIANTPGLIDSGYRDEIGVILENISPCITDIDYDFISTNEIKIRSIAHGSIYSISKGEKFAQLRLVEVPKAIFYEVESINDFKGDRGGGFGSSGRFIEQENSVQPQETQNEQN